MKIPWAFILAVVFIVFAAIAAGVPRLIFTMNWNFWVCVALLAYWISKTRFGTVDLAQKE
jgi:hypothetical protein